MKCSFIGPVFKGRAIGVDGQECTNFYLEQNMIPESKSPWSLIGTPGLELFAQVGNGLFRGWIVSARERLLIAVGNQLLELFPDRSTKIIGLLKTFKGPMTFAEIQTSAEGYSSQIMCVDGVAGYVYDTAASTFTQLTGDYQAGTSIVAVGNRFIQNINDTAKAIYSEPYSATFHAGLNYIVAEGLADPIVSIQTINNELWLIGSKSTEIWTQTGLLDNPYARSSVGFVNTGAAGKYCSATANNQLLWIGNNKTVWQASGYLPARISTHAIEYIIGQIGDISDCIAYSYQQEGHQFVIFNFVSGNRTLVYDLITGMWHERASFEKMTGENNRHRVTSAVAWQGMTLAADTGNNNIYSMSLDNRTDNGEIIKRIRVAPHIHEDRKRLFFNEFEIDMLRGVGLLPTAQGEDPQVMLSWSNDGGYTYGNEHWITAGRIGKRLTRIHMHRLGMSRDRVFKAVFTDPVKWLLIDARIDAKIEVG